MNQTKFNKRFDEMMTGMREAQQVKCPRCGYVFNCDDMQELITCWGENGPQDEECPSCKAKLTIEEHVERTYDVKLAV